MARDSDSLLRQIAALDDIINMLMPDIRKDVEEMICRKEMSEQRIESMLDSLLGYIPLGHGICEFRLLNSYYSTINRENSAEYDRFFNEALSEE